MVEDVDDSDANSNDEKVGEEDNISSQLKTKKLPKVEINDERRRS